MDAFSFHSIACLGYLLLIVKIVLQNEFYNASVCILTRHTHLRPRIFISSYAEQCPSHFPSLRCDCSDQPVDWRISGQGRHQRATSKTYVSSPARGIYQFMKVDFCVVQISDIVVSSDLWSTQLPREKENVPIPLIVVTLNTIWLTHRVVRKDMLHDSSLDHHSAPQCYAHGRRIYCLLSWLKTIEKGNGNIKIEWKFIELWYVHLRAALITVSNNLFLRGQASLSWLALYAV